MDKKRDYLPELVGVFVALAALNLWYFSSLAIDKAVLPSSFALWAQLCTAAFGAFFGSYCAFKLRKHEEKQSQLNSRKAALDSCLFTLIRQRNAIHLIKREYDKFSSPIIRAICMPANKHPEYKDLRLNFDELSFLAELGEIQTLLELTIEQELFEQMTYSAENRTKFCLEKLQPALELHDIDGKEFSENELRNLLGKLIFDTAKNASESTYKLLKANEQSNAKTWAKMYDVAKTIFPDKKFLKNPS